MRTISPEMPLVAHYAQLRGITAVPDAFDGTEELKVSDDTGHRLLRIEAESGVIDQELLNFLSEWSTKPHPH